MRSEAQFSQPRAPERLVAEGRYRHRGCAR